MIQASSVFRRDNNEQNIVLKHGKHVYVTDAQGREYLDGISGALVVSLGYGNEEIIEVLVRQAKDLSYSHNARFTTEVQEQLASKLSELLNDEYKVYFCGSGSEVVDAAIRVQYAYNKCIGNKNKHKVISFRQSYHGSTLGALSVSGIDRIKGFYRGMFPSDSSIINDCIYDQKTSCAACDSLEKDGKEFKQIGAFIFEPVSANVLGGMARCATQIDKIIELQKQYGFLIIADEIATAVARTGKDFSFQYFDLLRPDMICVSKILGAGYTNIGCLLVKKHVCEVIEKHKVNILGNTYNGNPIACAVGCKVMDIIARENYSEVNKIVGKKLIQQIKTATKNSDFVYDVRGAGLLIALEIRDNGKVVAEGASLSKKIFAHLIEHGLIVLPGTGDCVKRSDHFLLAPAFTFLQKDFDRLLDILSYSMSNEKLSKLFTKN